jgi:exopolysaccharide biosynthesis polyprenyl glycosylphosphotransferase
MDALATGSVKDRQKYVLTAHGARARLGAARRGRVCACLLAADAASTTACIALAHVLFAGVIVAPGGFGVAIGVMLCFFAGAGLYAASGPGSIERLRLRVLAITAFSAVLFVAAGTITPEKMLAFITLLVMLTLAGYYAELFVVKLLQRRGLSPATALIVGHGSKAEALVRELVRRPVLGVRPVAVFTPIANGDERVSGGMLGGLPVITDLNALAEQADVAIVVGRSSLMALERRSRREDFSSIVLLADNDTEQSLWLGTRSLGTGLGIETDKAFRLDRNPSIKRVMDIVLAAILAIPAALLTLLAAVAVKIVDPGPAFYVQNRTGRDGKAFQILKVRTMYRDSELRLEEHLNAHPQARKDWEQRCKLTDDPRILPWVGSLLRRTSIDEIPQIWNVLCGEMSMVGPRPFPDYHLERFDNDFKSLRISVPPGLTGFWQISTRSEGDLEAQKADDLFYIRNRSLWLDLYILLQTLPAVVSGTGAR